MNKEDLWNHTNNENEVPCHTRVIGGVLCRWWGKLENKPLGADKLDEAFPDKEE